MANQAPFALDEATLYFSTTAGGATPAAGNQLGDFRGEVSFTLSQAHALWRGQDRFAKNVVVHESDLAVTIPGFALDSSIVFTRFWNGTTTGATTTHGGSYAGREDKITKNTKAMLGEWLIQGTNQATGKITQVLIHSGFMTGINPTLARTDFAALDINLVCLQDAAGDVVSIFQAT